MGGLKGISCLQTKLSYWLLLKHFCFHWLLICLWTRFTLLMIFFMAFLISLIYIERTKGLEPVQTELKDDEALPKLLVFGIALIGLGLLIANTALVAWFIIRKRIKGKNNTKPIFSPLFAFLLAERFFVVFYLISFFPPLPVFICWFPLLDIFPFNACFYSLGQFSLWLLFRHWF